MTIKEFIEKHEGRVDHIYLCPAGYKTIGVGWNMESNPLPNHIKSYLDENNVITDNMIDELLDVSINRAQSDCKKLFPNFDKFDENKKIALTDFIFNIGYSRAKKFKDTIKAINEENWELVVNELKDSLWYKQVKFRAQDVLNLIMEV